MKHTVKQKFKKAACLFLAILMFAGTLPMTIMNVAAASNMGSGGLAGEESDTYSTLNFEGLAQDVFSALGFDVSVLPEGYDPNTTDNPYGKTKVVGNQIFEALIASSDGTGIFGKNDADITYAGIHDNAKNDAALPFELFAGTAADFDGDGLAGEVAYVGFESITRNDVNARPELYLMVYDAYTYTLSGKLKIGTTNPAQVIPKGGEKYSAFDYAWQNMLQITAGDYDGDGTSEIAVYVPEHGRIRVDIYKFLKTSESAADDWLTIDNWDCVWSYTISNKDSEIPNMVSLVSADINRDGVDDLGISYGRFAPENNSNKFSSAITNSKAFMLWGSRETMLQSQTPIDLNDSSGDFGALTRVSLNTGDLDGDGYKELIATGHPVYDLTSYFANGYYVSAGNADDKQNTARTVTTYIYDSEQGLIIHASELLRPVDGEMVSYEYTDDNGSVQKGTTWTSNNGFNEKNWSAPLMRTNATVVRLEGHEYPFLYLDSSLYEYTEGKLTLKMALDEDGNLYDGQNTLIVTGDTANPHWGISYQKGGVLVNAHYAEFGAVSADINGSGYDVLMTGFIRDYSQVSKDGNKTHSTGFGVLSSVSDGTLAIKVDNNGITATGDTHTTTKLRYPLMVDADTDTVIIEYTGQHWLTYSDPKVLAVIAASPYFQDVEDVTGGNYAWQNTTSYATVSGSASGEHVTVDFSVGAYTEGQAGIFGVKASAGGFVGFTLNWEEETTKSTEYTLTFEASGGEDQVAFFSLPTENYKYKVYTPDGKGGYIVEEQVISNDFTPVYQVLSLDYYETVQQMYPKELPVLRGNAITSTPGDPASYPTSSGGYDVIAEWKDDPAAVSFGNGSITQEITITEEESEKYTLGAQLDFRVGLGSYTQSDLFQSMTDFEAGVEFSLNPAGGWSKINLSGTTISGTVTNMPTRFQDYGYYYSWHLFSYQYKTSDGSSIPVVSYVVNDVSAPPELPDDFQQDVERTTSNKNVLTWTYDGSFSKFYIYKYYEFPVGGGLQQIAEIASDTPNYRVKYDQNGDIYKEYYFEDTNLTPYTEYTYAIQVERLSEVPPLSSPSAHLTVRTKAEYGYPSVIMDESDGENDGKLLVYPDKAAYLTAQVRGTNGEPMNDFYTVVQYQWQKKVNGAWVDMEGETSVTLTFAQVKLSDLGDYRCRLNLLVKENANAITTYTDAINVNVSLRSSYFENIYIMDTAGGKITVYAKVANAHSESSSIPTGEVNFILTDNKTGLEYKSSIALDTTGVATATVSGLPAGVYTVEGRYRGSTIFKSAVGESVYLSKQLIGYDIAVPDGIVYGDGAELTNRLISKNGNMTVTQSVKDGGYSIRVAAELSTSRISGSAATAATVGEGIRVGYQYSYAHNGTTYYFIAPRSYSAMPEVILQDGYILFGEATGVLEYSGFDGDYIIPETAPAGSYLLTMINGEETAKAFFEIARRPIIVQLPAQKTPQGYQPPSVYLRELELVEGSYAAHDIKEDGSLVDGLANKSVYLDYINTAGTHYTLYTFYQNLGYYIMRDKGDNDKSPRAVYENYDVTYLDGSVVVFGGAQDVTAGTRYFEDQAVGTLYAVSPDYEYTKSSLADGGIAQAHAIGNRLVFTAVPDAGYEVYDWFINGVAQNNRSTSLAYVIMAEPVTIEVQFTLSRNILNFGELGDTEGGSLVNNNFTLASGSLVLSNSYYVFTAIADEGYHFKEWRYTEEGKGTVYDNADAGKSGSTFELLMPDVSCSVFAVFERDSYTFEVSDRSGGNGIVAWYIGNATGDMTVPDEKIYIKSGDSVKGDTLITVEAAPGYSLDPDYAFVSSGSIGSADYEAGTYTLSLTTDTTVSAVAVRNYYDLDVSFDVVRYEKDGEKLGSLPKATLTVGIDGVEQTVEYSADAPTATVSDIPGGSRVKLSIDLCHYYSFIGYEYAAFKLTSSEQMLRLATKVLPGDTVEAGGQYWYPYPNADGYTTVGYFTSPVDGIVRYDGNAVTVFSSAKDFTFDAIAKAESVSIRLEEKPVYTVYMPDVSDKGEYTLVEAPDGSVKGDGFVSVHAGDAITVLVTPNEKWTVSYWNIEDLDEEQDYRVRVTSLKYTLTDIYKNVRMTPEFSSSAYHEVVWDTVAADKNGVILSPEVGNLSTVKDGGSFSFKLSAYNRPESDIIGVYANGEKLTADASGVYTVTDIFRKVEITVELKPIGITVDGVDVTYLNGDGWSYDRNAWMLTLTGDGLTLSGKENTGTLAPFIINIEASVKTVILDGLELHDDFNNAYDTVTDTGFLMSGSELVLILKNTNYIQSYGTTVFENVTFKGDGSLVWAYSGYAPQKRLVEAESITVTGNAFVSFGGDEYFNINEYFQITYSSDYDSVRANRITVSGKNAKLKATAKLTTDTLTVDEGELIIYAQYNALYANTINLKNATIEMRGGFADPTYRAMASRYFGFTVNVEYPNGYLYFYGDRDDPATALKYYYSPGLSSNINLTSPEDWFQSICAARVAPIASQTGLTVQIDDHEPQSVPFSGDTGHILYCIEELADGSVQFHEINKFATFTKEEYDKIRKYWVYAYTTGYYHYVRRARMVFTENTDGTYSIIQVNSTNVEQTYNVTLKGYFTNNAAFQLAVRGASITVDNFFCTKPFVVDHDTIYLKGDNYFLQGIAIARSGRITAIKGDGAATLTVLNGTLSVSSTTTCLELYDLRGVTLMNGFSGNGTGTVTVNVYSNGKAIPHRQGWAVITGENASLASEDWKFSGLTPTSNYIQVRYFSAEANVPATIIDRASFEQDKTVTVSPPVVNGVVDAVSTEGKFAELIDDGGRVYDLELTGENADLTIKSFLSSSLTFTIASTVTFSHTSELFNSLENGEYTLRIYLRSGAYLELPLTLADSNSDKNGDRLTPRYTEVTGGSRVVLEYSFDTWESGHSFAWIVDGQEIRNNSLALSYVVPENATPGDVIEIGIVRYDAQGNEYNRVTARILVLPSAESVEISTGDVILGSDGYELDYGASAELVWDFDAKVTLNDGTVIENADVIWSVSGSNMRLTAIDANGVLTVSEKEGGSDGRITLIAMYKNADGSEFYYPVELILPETLCTSEEYRLTHNYDETVTDQPCTADGYITYRCLECGHSYIVTAADHSFTEYVADGNASCTEDGTKTATCDNGCGTTDTVANTGGALGHSFTTYASDGNATCTENGTETAICDHCDATDVRTDADTATGHSYDNACDADCNTCGESYGEPAAHTYENGACTVCGAADPTDSAPVPPDEEDGLGTGAIVAIVLSSVAVLGGGGFAVYWFVIRKRKRISF